MKKYLIYPILILLLVISGCNIKTNNLDDGWIKVGESKHFTYYSHPNNGLEVEVINDALDRLEQFWGEVQPFWKFPDTMKIRYYKFKDKKQLSELTNYNVSGKALLGKNTVYSIYFSDAHEVSHIFSTFHITSESNANVAVSNFWLEGIAMYYTWPWVYYGDQIDIKSSIGFMNGHSINFNTQQLLLEENLPDLESFVYGNKTFNNINELHAYSAAGSFITYLLGLEQSNPNQIQLYKDFLIKINECNSSSEVKIIFKEQFGMDFDTALIEWQDYLQKWNETVKNQTFK